MGFCTHIFYKAFFKNSRDPSIMWNKQLETTRPDMVKPVSHDPVQQQAFGLLSVSNDDSVA